MPKISDLFVLLRRRIKFTHTHGDTNQITVPSCLLPLLLCASSLSSSVLCSPLLGQIIHRMLMRYRTNLTPVAVSCSNHQPTAVLEGFEQHFTQEGTAVINVVKPKRRMPSIG